MELRPGYKQTDIGIIPSDWKVDFVEHVAQITTGNKNTQDHVQDGAYPFFVRSQTVERINSYSFDGEAVLTAGDGVGTGKVFHYINGKFDVHQRVYRISDFDERVNGYFFYLYFSTHFYDRIMQMTAKSSVDSVRRDMIARMLIPIPPKDTEQCAIATALSDVDALLDGLDRLIAKKRDLKQAAMQQLLTGQTRLPGFSGEWKLKPLGALAEITMGQSPESKYYNRTGAGVPLIQGNADIEDHRTVKRVWTTHVTKRGQAGDLVLTVRAPVGATGRILEPCCLGRGVCSLRATGDSDFLFHALLFAEKAWQVLEQGSTFTSANSTQIAAFSIRAPSGNTEQTAIAAVLSDMDAEIAALEARRAKTRDLKQAMMQELLTGHIRLAKPGLSEGT